MKLWCLVVAGWLVGCRDKEPAPTLPVATPPPAASSAAVLQAPSAAPAASGGLAILDGFEGQISWIATESPVGSKKHPQPLNGVVLVKDKTLRFELPPGLASAQGLPNAYVVAQPEQKKFYIVMDSKKQAVHYGVDGLLAREAQGRAYQPVGEPPVVEKTANMANVAGFACEIWNIKSKSSRMELCVAAEGAPWLRLEAVKLPAEYAWVAELMDGKHFALRLIRFDKAGVEVGRLELTGIEKKVLAAALFEVPAGYSILDLDRKRAAKAN